MKKNCLLYFLLTLFSSSAFADKNLDSLLNVLDRTIENFKTYSQIKENRLYKLKENAKQFSPFSVERYNLNCELYDEYKSYSSDSALYYLNENLLLVRKIKDKEREFETQLELSYLLSSMGMYMESSDILKSIERNTLPLRLLGKYYSCYEHVYSEAAAARPRYRPMYTRYSALAKIYRDSMLTKLDPLSDTYLWIQEDFLKGKRKYEEALRINQQRLSKATFGVPPYASITYQRFGIYRNMGEGDNHLYLLVLSAISDIRSVAKTQSSLMTLAQILCEKGDLKRAYVYMNFSWKLSQAYNARMRRWVSIGPFSMINGAYQDIIHEQNRKLQICIICVALLALLLIVATVYIYRQMKTLAMAKIKLQKMNEGLSSLNDELNQMNQNLLSVNLELSDSNRIKEVYIAHFFKLYSNYIDRLQAYRKLVNKKIQKRQFSDLLKMSSENNSLMLEMQELYTNFDSAFLHLFPNFVKDFNELLVPEEQIILKPGELLNTELRIFALIRLGIKDSSQIAELLHYSVNTIYNYRARVKNKARVLREDFEVLITQIQ